MKRGYANIFPLDGAEMFYCTLQNYFEGSSKLRIKVVTPSHSHFYLHFSNVKYLSIPTQWVGANFQLARSDYLKAFLASLGYSQAICDYYVRDFGSSLYTINNGDFAARIIASDIEQHDTPI